MSFLTGKRALIVGLASNRSIAYGIAEAMHREGAELAFTYQNDRLQGRVEKMAGKFDSDITVPCNVESDEEIEKVKELIHILIPILHETAEIRNFWTKAAERKRVEGMIEDEIHYSGVEVLSKKAAELTIELMKLAKNRERDLK